MRNEQARLFRVDGERFLAGKVLLEQRKQDARPQNAMREIKAGNWETRDEGRRMRTQRERRAESSSRLVVEERNEQKEKRVNDTRQRQDKTEQLHNRTHTRLKT